MHVLNKRPKAMALQRYSADFSRLTVDLLHQHYSFLQDIAPTILHQDIVWWSEEMKAMWILELTI